MGPSGLHRLRPFAYKYHFGQNPSTVFDISSTGPERRRHRRQDSGDKILCSGTLPGWGIAPGVISIDSTAISIAVADYNDEE